MTGGAPVVDNPDRLLTPGEVAALFRVDPKTVGRWSNRGKLPAIYTPGGHRRYRWAVVREALAEHEESGGL